MVAVLRSDVMVRSPRDGGVRRTPRRDGMVGVRCTPRQGEGSMAGREQLNRDRVLRAAVSLADEAGLDAISMRKLSQHLGVVPMALYKHVANKDELLDGMVDAVLAEIDPPESTLGWKAAVRGRILSARAVLLRHPWARRVMESKTTPTPMVLGYMDSTIAIFLAGGLSVDLTHHVMHALGS